MQQTQKLMLTLQLPPPIGLFPQLRLKLNILLFQITDFTLRLFQPMDQEYYPFLHDSDAFFELELTLFCQVALALNFEWRAQRFIQAGQLGFGQFRLKNMHLIVNLLCLGGRRNWDVQIFRGFQNLPNFHPLLLLQILSLRQGHTISMRGLPPSNLTPCSLIASFIEQRSLKMCA